MIEINKNINLTTKKFLFVGRNEKEKILITLIYYQKKNHFKIMNLKQLRMKI